MSFKDKNGAKTTVLLLKRLVHGKLGPIFLNMVPTVSEILIYETLNGANSFDTNSVQVWILFFNYTKNFVKRCTNFVLFLYGAEIWTR